ncbi:hypothetical protein ABN584_27850 [Gloeocapsa sp. BRSZ]
MSRTTQCQTFKEIATVPNPNMPGVNLEGFHQVPNFMAIRAIQAKLTAADWALWSYLQMLDPYGDRMIELPKVSEIAAAIQVSDRQVRRSLARLEELELYLWEPVVIRGQNLAGKQAKELCQRKKENKLLSRQQKMTDSSAGGQDCPEGDKSVQQMTNLSESRQVCPNQKLKASFDKTSSFPQTNQTYTDFIQTLSDNEREKFRKFALLKAKNLPKEPTLPERWVEANWQELYAQFKLTTEAAAAYVANTDWTRHPDWEDWLAQMREGVPRFVALGTCFDNKTRKAMSDWADERGLIWGAES